VIDARTCIAEAVDGLWLAVGSKWCHVPAFASAPGDRLLLVPDVREETVDVAAALARALTGLHAPGRGGLRLFDQPLTALSYLETLKMRARLGLVQGRGALLSNRTVRANVTLPLSVHGGLSHAQEVERVTELLEDLELLPLQDLRPHVLDDAARFRACAARALVLQPQWLVVEGMGDFEAGTHGSHTWRRMLHHVDLAQGAIVVCLPRKLAAFEHWWQSHGGRIVQCHITPSLPDVS
jgi:predicted ABC-type transport system involved in lysophospholipase L1 biosynthesis ATPase subunit